MPQHPESPPAPLERLAAQIERAGLTAPMVLVLDALRPLDFLSSQLALFVQPFTQGSAWEGSTRALTTEAGWAGLRTLLAPKAPAGEGTPTPDD